MKTTMSSNPDLAQLDVCLQEVPWLTLGFSKKLKNKNIGTYLLKNDWTWFETMSIMDLNIGDQMIKALRQQDVFYLNGYHFYIDMCLMEFWPPHHNVSMSEFQSILGAELTLKHFSALLFARIGFQFRVCFWVSPQTTFDLSLNTVHMLTDNRNTIMLFTFVIQNVL